MTHQKVKNKIMEILSAMSTASPKNQGFVSKQKHPFNYEPESAKDLGIAVAWAELNDMLEKMNYFKPKSTNN